MPLNATRSLEAVNAALDAQTALLDNGFMDLYSGAQPASPDTPITSQVLLASLQLGALAFTSAVAGVADLASPAVGVAVANGSASWVRFFKSDHASPVHDGSVGLSGANLNLTSTVIIAGGALSVDSYILTEKKAP